MRRDWNLLEWFILAVIFVLLFAITGLGCSSLTQRPEAASVDAIYRHMLKIKVDDQTIDGVGVIPLKSSYHLKIYPDGRADRILIHTCHREIPIDEPSSGWSRLIGGKSIYELDVKRDAEVETSDACAMEVQLFEEKKKRNGWALLEFQDARPEVSLPALVQCDGSATTFNGGVSICQAAEGLIQEIKFKTPVVNAGSDPECDVMQSKDKLTYRFAMAPGICTYYFVAQKRHTNGKRLVHRLKTIGYSDIPPVK